MILSGPVPWVDLMAAFRAWGVRFAPVWLAGAGRPDFPAVAVLRVAGVATMRQACTASGIDPNAPLVGIPAAAF
jgi:hypothetical protein